eukprot:4422009-Pyramimonas_sp.AAC.1
MQVGNAEITYMFSVVSFVAFWLFLYGVNLTAPGDSFINWSYLYNAFAFIDPYLLSGLGVAMAIGLSVLGAAWYVSFRRHFYLRDRPPHLSMDTCAI